MPGVGRRWQWIGKTPPYWTVLTIILLVYCVALILRFAFSRPGHRRNSEFKPLARADCGRWCSLHEAFAVVMLRQRRMGLRLATYFVILVMFFKRDQIERVG